MAKTIDPESLDEIARITLARMQQVGPLPCILDAVQNAEYELGHAMRWGVLVRGDEDSREALAALHQTMKRLHEGWKMARVLIKDAWNQPAP